MPMTTTESNIQAVLDVFRILEQRDGTETSLEPLVHLCHADVELCWPPSLPYGGTSRGLLPTGTSWRDVWDPLQPTQAERSMSPRVIAATDREVVVLYRQRGVNQRGVSFATEVLGVYEMLDGKLSRAQMFYFDEQGTNRFLASSTG
jgi:ketosteroid isomerase-like protein